MVLLASGELSCLLWCDEVHTRHNENAPTQPQGIALFTKYQGPHHTGHDEGDGVDYTRSHRRAEHSHRLDQ